MGGISLKRHHGLIRISLIFLEAIITAGLTFALLPVLYNGKTISSKQLEFLKLFRNENEYLDVEELYVNGNPAIESKSENWWLCSVNDLPNGDELFSPKIEAKISVPRRYYAVIESNITAKSVENNQPVTIAVFTLRGYKLIRLHLTDLPIMSLYFNGSLLNGEETVALFEKHNGTVKLRGATSSLYPKHSYKIVLDEKTSFFDMRKDDDWILISLYNDPERVRNVLGANLWYTSCAGQNCFDVINGYEFHYIELFINDYYSGLYALGYKPDQKQFEISDNEYLYSKDNWGEDEIELHGSKTKNNQKLAMESLENDYNIDEQSAINHWLFVNFCAGCDNTGKNYYFALKKGSDGLHKMVVCPWDLDLTWGNSYTFDNPNKVDIYSIPVDTAFNLIDGLIYDALEQHHMSMIQKLQSRYIDLRDTFWSDENLNSLIDKYEDKIFGSGAYARDMSIWPESSLLEDTSVHLDLFREYVLARANWMDQYIAGLS